ncbi:MAG: Uma2 family endonuclease [Acidobacteriota bacterium]|nr:Uma2 family endonuclease [Acidobacteriota bacterium]
MSALPKPYLTIEEYIELDKNSEERFEYFDGEIFAMAGSSHNHARISSRICSLLEQKLFGGKCEAFNCEVRVKVPAELPYRYPDVSVVCGEPIFEMIQGVEMLVNPVLIIEVLSPSTAAYDLDAKFTAYQSIESFREYLLVAQDRPHVIHYTRQSKGRWLRTEVSGLQNEVRLSSVKVTLPLSEIYARVKFQS